MENILVNTGRPQAVLLVDIHLGTWLRASRIGECSHLFKLLLKFIVSVTLEGDLVISWIGLVASIGPLALCCMSCDKLLLLLLALQHLEFLDDCDCSPVPDVFH